jgi:hypothetical protein
MQQMNRVGAVVGVACSALCVTGCQGVVWGNLAILVASIGIFLGTLSLGRNR